jgi:hypothetical protein
MTTAGGRDGTESANVTAELNKEFRIVIEYLL